MIKVSRNISGHSPFRLGTIHKEIPVQIRQALFTIGESLKQSADHEILYGNKTGRIYRIYSRRGSYLHQASARDETHANRSGKLRRSLGWKARGSNQLEFGYGVTRSAPNYASYVEKGTSRMKARPTLKNALRAEERNTLRDLERALGQVFK